ncbi:MAG TPA: thioredoxin family protein [archaeon]|nr:thioredoxin family protein [archaeon]
MDAKKPFFSPNNPVLIALVIALIFAGFVLLESLKSPEQANAPASAQEENSIPEMMGKFGLQKAPELAGISGYVNAEPNLTLASLKGKVVIVDFWTYSCINCIRTTPYLNAWHEKYSDDGLVIIGVHAPEFEFEKDYSNVKSAVEKFGIKYPVVQDNDFATWRAYSNQYWPHKFLVDADGYIRYDHIGEGGYSETEQKIVELLKERDAAVELESGAASGAVSPEFGRIGTPEIYLGYGFARVQLGNPEGFRPEQIVPYSLPAQFTPNIAYLEGEWENKNDYARLVSASGKVALVFTAKNVNIVAGNMQGSSLITARIDNSSLNSSNAGTDASTPDFSVAVRDQKLYNVVSLPDYSQKTLVMDVNGAGFELYTFTFG